MARDVKPSTIADTVLKLAVLLQAGVAPARAEHLALSITPSQWAPTTTPFEVSGRPGWRVAVVTEADRPSDDLDDSTRGIATLRTTYVFAVAGRLAVAQLSPLAPTAAALVMPLAEQLLPTLKVHHDE